MVLQSLIDKQDTREIIRDTIAALLIAERDNQKSLAQVAGKDPALWDFQLYVERYYPLGEWLNNTDERPIVIVWFENESPDETASDTVHRQTVEGGFNIDIFARGVGDASQGGDQVSYQNVHRAVRLIRNIIMAGPNHQLGLQGLVAHRRISNLTIYQPREDNKQAHAVVAARIDLRIRYNEFSPQYEPQNLEDLFVDLAIADTGEVIGWSLR